MRRSGNFSLAIKTIAEYAYIIKYANAGFKYLNISSTQFETR